MSHIARSRVFNAVSSKAESCLEYIKGISLLSAESDVEISADEEVPSEVVVAIVHDGRGFNPLSTISISKSWGVVDTLDDAHESLYHYYLDNYPDYVLEVAEESGGDYDRTEGWGEAVFTLTFREVVYVVLEAGLRGVVYIDDQDVLNIDKGWLKSEGFL